MARKESDIIEQLADTICNYIVYNGSKAGKETAPNDKTYSATILGVNRKFTDNVSEDEQAEIIEKFSIPETVGEGEDNYYTFKINGVYYCKQQNGDFKLYDKIMVYIPNGDWSRMYFDYDTSYYGNSKYGNDGSNVDVPNVIFAVDEPGGDTTAIDDFWFVADNYTSEMEFTDLDQDTILSIYQYLENEDTGITAWYKSVLVPSKDLPAHPEIGDYHIKLDNDTGKCAQIYKCTNNVGTITWHEVYPENKEVNVTISDKAPMKVGDYWIPIDDEEVRNMLGWYEYQRDPATLKEDWIMRCKTSAGNGVGEWLDPDHTTERFNDYYQTHNTSDAKYDHLEGYDNSVTTGIPNWNWYGMNHVEGNNNHAYGRVHNSYMGGSGNTFGDSSNMSFLVSMCMMHGDANTLKSGAYSYVSGSQCTIDYASMSMIIGDSLTLKYVTDSVVSGQSISATSNWAQIQHSIIGGGRHSITNEVYCSIWSGLNNTGRANCGLVVGEDNEVNAIRSMTCGRGNKNTQTDSIMCGYYGTNGDWDYYRIAVGGGSGTSDRRNIFGVDINGDVYGRSYNTMGADYAEYFEWADGNPENEDRCGILVMLDGDRIVPAHGDDILGAVSAAPSVIGNSADLYWQGTYATDIYGRPVTNGKGERMLSSAYDPGLKYIPRSKRKEWDAVGLVGRLVIRDNGSCTVGGYCTADRGIANPANNKTNVRVLKRINDTHIEVLIK